MRHLVFLIVFVFSLQASAQKGFELVEKKQEKKIEVKYKGQLLTAYCYFDSTEKPILFPLKTLSGKTITRGFPITPRPGERTDHPHHAGLWLNYESVNGLDFWNNSDAIVPEKKHLYGSIKHQRVLKRKEAGERAELQTASHWVDQKGNVLLEEITTFVFRVDKGAFIIDRASQLKAVAPEVLFKDVKDGFLGIRVARELEMPSSQEDKFVDSHGNITAVSKKDNTGVTGMYRNKEGVTGDEAWGKRSVWTVLQGMKEGEKISLAIIDHPKNIGYPTYWHARGYGLFAANPLGQSVFSNGKETLNLKLKKGDSVQFNYRIVIHSGSDLSPEQINAMATQFSSASF